MSQANYDYYSVDASVMIELKDSLPYDLFQPAWDEIGRLVDTSQWKIFENVVDEIHDETIKQWLKKNNTAIVNFNPEINKFMNRLMAELQNNGIMLIDPMSLKNSADPFVVMLALYLEGRDLSNLRKKQNNKICCILTQEKLKTGKINIPSVCKYYDIPHMDLFGLMRYHGWRITLDVQNP